MANGSIPVEVGDSSFDLGQVGEWIGAHPYLTAIIILVAYIFWISRKDGLLGAMLEYRIKRRELDTEVESDRLKLVGQLKQDGDTLPRVASADDGPEAGREI
jgi:hypothetical protein